MGKKRAGGVRIKQMAPKGMPANPAAMPTFEDLMTPPEEMIHLPPTPDRKYQIIWPIQETFSLQTDGFQVIYPSYLDSTKTVKQGRRLVQELAIPSPTCNDLSQALQQLQVRHVLQPYKGYSRDITCLWDNPGRVLVDVSQYKKAELMREMAQRIPSLPARVERLARQAQERAAEEQLMLEEKAKEEAAAASKQKKQLTTGSGKKAAAGSGNAKKKGKKGKKK